MTRAPGHLFRRREIDPAVVLSALAKIDEQHRRKAWSALLGGTLLCGASVLILTIVYYLLDGFAPIGGHGFGGTYGIVGAVCLPLLVLLAVKMPGSILEQTVPNSDLLQTRFIGRHLTMFLVVIEMANIGPRLTLWGVRQIRGRSAFGVVRRDRAAAALVTLAQADGSIPPAKLLLPGESADALEPLLGVLLYHDLADLSKRADRVWITTDAKRKLGLHA
jgi:hypothetical protein